MTRVPVVDDEQIVRGPMVEVPRMPATARRASTARSARSSRSPLKDARPEPTADDRGRTCVVADDHPALLEAIVALLEEQGFEVVATAADGESALEAVAAEVPAVAVVDYRMPRGAGCELIRRVRGASPETRVAVYTAAADWRLVDDAFDAGADALVLKEAPLLDLVRAVEALLKGRQYIDPGLATLVLSPAGRGVHLTERELDVLRLLAEGLSHEQAGQRLQIAGETARTHARKAAARLGARTRTQAVAEALRLRLIS